RGAGGGRSRGAGGAARPPPLAAAAGTSAAATAATPTMGNARRRMGANPMLLRLQGLDRAAHGEAGDRAAREHPDAAALLHDTEAVARRREIGEARPALRRRVVGVDRADRACRLFAPDREDPFAH